MKKLFSLCLLLCAGVAVADRLYISKVGLNETPVLEDGEWVVGVHPDGEPVQIKVGDGLTSGGRILYDSRTTIRTSPIQTIQEKDYTVSLSGAAYWTNGLISLFPPDTLASTNEGIVTITLLFSDQKIQAVRTTDTGRDYSLTTKIAADGRTATLTGKMQSLNYPGVHPTIEGYIEAFQIDVYSDGSLVDTTNDLRGMSLLVRHPGRTVGKTNLTDHLAMTRGYYEHVAQDAVSLWSGHAALSQVTVRAGMRIDDGVSMQQRFVWGYRPSGYLTLSHVSDTEIPVMSVEAIDPFPWICSDATGEVSTLVFTTNGVAGTFRLQTCSDLTDSEWVDARPLSTNPAAPGYMSITASNTLSGQVVFWKVSVSNAVQASARVAFGVPVMAPRFTLAPGVDLFWTNGTLMLSAGGSNATVGLTWQEPAGRQLAGGAIGAGRTPGKPLQPHRVAGCPWWLVPFAAFFAGVGWLVRVFASGGFTGPGS